MSNMQVEKYVRVSAQALLYDKSPKVIDNLVDRQTIRYFPQTSRTANPNDQVVFEISSDSFADLPSFVLSFDLNFSGTSTSGDTQIASALDIFEINEVYYNDVPCDRIINGGAWNNTFLNLASSRSWVDEEGSIMLGLNNQFTSKNSNPTNRRYVVPVALLLPFFRINQYCPLVSNKLRITFTLAPSERVITRTWVNNCTYSISNISLTGDIVVASPEHRNAVINAMKMSTMRIPFLSYDCGSLSVTGTKDNYLRINQNHSNALSLHMLYNNNNQKILTYDGNYNLYYQSFPLPNFYSLTVRSGSKMFTTSDGIQTLEENFISSKKCISGFNNIECGGLLDYNTLHGGYTKSTSITGDNYGLVLLSVNLEKTMASDEVSESVINNGLAVNSQGSTDIMDIYLKTSTELNGSNNIFYNICHRRNLVFENGVCRVEW